MNIAAIVPFIFALIVLLIFIIFLVIAICGKMSFWWLLIPGAILVVLGVLIKWLSDYTM